jgi:hypothetical protein
VGTGSPEDLRDFSAVEKGDAPALVRAEVLQALRRFEDGYVRRDPAQLEAFMHGLFPEGDPVLLLGADSGEWVGGYGPISSFIRNDGSIGERSGSKWKTPWSAAREMWPGWQRWVRWARETRPGSSGLLLC